MLSFKLLLSEKHQKNICFVGYSVQQKQESIFFLLQILYNIRLVRPWAKSSGLLDANTAILKDLVHM